MRRAFQLSEDEECLAACGLRWEAVIENNVKWLVFPNYPIPEGYNHRSASAALRIPPSYPDDQIDMVYFSPALALTNGRAIGQLSPLTFDGKPYQQWSRHRTNENPWRPGLDNVCIHQRFSPEIARRLGNPAFTKQLSISSSALNDFVERPIQLLQEVIRTLDPASRAAIALVFMRGGWLPSPVNLLPEEENAVGLLGASPASVRAALAPLDGSLLIEVKQKGQYGWRAKHPTVLDAFAALVVESRELMDIYLAGTPVLELFSEISCGADGIGGTKVEIPADRYEGLIKRIIAFHDDRRENRGAVNSFLANRCGKEFLRLFLERYPDFVAQLHVMSYFYAVSSIDFLNVIHDFGLLAEDQRRMHASTVRKLAIQTPDAGFLDRRIISFLTQEEIEDILADFRDQLLPFVDIEIENWKDNYSSRETPGDYFEPFRSALSEFKTAMADDLDVVSRVESALAAVDEAITTLDTRGSEEPDYGDYYNRSSGEVATPSSRSIFDDVDT